MTYCKRILSVFLVAAFLCLLPGMPHIVSAASDHASKQQTFSETLSSDTNVQKSATLSATEFAVKKDLSATHQSGILQTAQLLSSANQAVTLASAAASSDTPPDMMAALTKANPVFSIQNSTNESIDVNTGSLNIRYPLASMAGVNGMDLSLDLRYSSFDANTLEKGYVEYHPIVIGYAVSYIKHSTYTHDDDVWYAQTGYTQPVSVADYSDFMDWIDSGPYTVENPVGYEPGTVEVFYLECVSDGYISGYMYNSTTAPKATTVASNGLSTGWHFGIPYIKQITAFDENGDPDLSGKRLVLDTGNSFELKDDLLHSSDKFEEDAFDYPDPYPGYAYQSAENLSFGNIAVAHVLTYKDGTEYYFDNSDICIGKKDRFGNTIRYVYDAANRLSAIYDDFGRSITVIWTENGFAVSSSDGSSVFVTVENGNIASITYNETETSAFSYATQNAKFAYDPFDLTAEEIPYVLLTEISHPNASKTTYVYSKNTASRPDGSSDEIFQIEHRFDTANGTEQNHLYYAYNGYYLTDYSYFEELALESNVDANSIWADQNVPCDVYAILSNYSTTVSDGVKQTTHHFNTNGYCCLTNVYENGKLLQSTESLYWGSILYATRETLADSAGDAVSFFTVYENDPIGNILSVEKYEEKDRVHYRETAEYNNPYYLITASAVENVTTVYTYTPDGKSLSSEKVYESGVLREQTDYTHDSRGNVLTEKFYILPGTQTVTTTYSYADTLPRAAGMDLSGLYCTSATVSGIKDSDGAEKASVVTASTYDAAGRVLSQTDANGNTTEYTYDLRGRQIRTDYPDGTYETTVYDIPNNRAVITNRAGYMHTCAYDVSGNVVSVTENASGAVLIAYTYDAVNRPITERVYHSPQTYRETRYTYDALDRVLTQKIYDETERLLSSEQTVYDVVLLQDAACQKITHTVAGDSSAPSVVTAEYVDPYGRTIRSAKLFEQTELAKVYEYDALDRLLKETDENNRTKQYTYQYAGKVLTETDALGAVLSYTYDSRGNVLTQTDALGNTVTCTYDVLGRLLTQSVPLDANATQISKFDYDNNGNQIMARVTNHAVGEAVSYSKTVNTYDAMNRLLSTVSYDGASPALTNTYTYNAYDKLLTMTVGGATTAYVYNARGEQTKTVDALAQEETYTYDLGGNLLTKTDRNGTVFTYTYDRLGRLLCETAANGNKTEQKTYEYSLSGALIREADDDVTITRRYDCLGRLIEETETANNKNAVARYAYTKTDERERYVQVYENETVVSEYYEYDAVGRLVKVYTSTAEWQPNDGTQAKEEPSDPDPEDPDPEPTLDPYDFDSYPDVKTYTIRSHYGDKVGDFKLIPTSGTELSFPVTYTVGGVPYGVCFSDDYWSLDFARGSLYANTYNGKTSYSGDYIFAFTDENGAEEITEHFYVMGDYPSGTECFCVYYVYDGTNVINSIGVSYPESATDPAAIWMYIQEGEYSFYVPAYGPLTLTASTETLIASYVYDANGNRISMTNANGTSTVYTYNKANLVTSVQNLSGDTVLSSHTYTYYLDGNIQSETENGETKSYEYDDLGRLTREVKEGILRAYDISYTYDARGNRATKTQGLATTTYSYDANNRLLAESAPGSTTVYTYDANGNTLSAMTDGSPAYSYTYGLFGTQDRYTHDGILYTDYTYRPDGLRHSVGDTVHLWDGANVVADVEDENIQVYFRGINLIYMEENGDITYYHFNAHGDVVLLTSENGTKEKSYEYSSFGTEYSPSVSDDNPFRYCGEYYDTVSGTVYLRARYYNSDLGRFTQQDGWEFAKQEDPLSLNLYTYCWNNPIWYIDPSGHDAVYITRYEGDDGGLPVAGHASVLIQAEDGTWYHVEFTGSKKKNASIRIEGNPYDEKQKGYASPNDFFKKENWGFDYMTTYIEGDFTESYEHALKLYKNDPTYGGYDLFFNNCHHFVREVLLQGRFKSMAIFNYFDSAPTPAPVHFHTGLIGTDILFGLFESAKEFAYDAFVEPVKPFYSWLKSLI